MTTLYRPVPIESVEQAEALPAFTVARYIDGDVRAAIKTVDGIWESVPGFYGEEAHFSEDFVGWTALVPIEAEEETVAVAKAADGTEVHYNPDAANDPLFGGYIGSLPIYARYITPWTPTEEA